MFNGKSKLASSSLGTSPKVDEPLEVSLSILIVSSSCNRKEGYMEKMNDIRRLHVILGKGLSLVTPFCWIVHQRHRKRKSLVCQPPALEEASLDLAGVAADHQLQKSQQCFRHLRKIDSFLSFRTNLLTSMLPILNYLSAHWYMISANGMSSQVL